MKKQFMPFITFITALFFIAAGCSQSPQAKETPPRMAAAAAAPAKKTDFRILKFLPPAAQLQALLLQRRPLRSTRRGQSELMP